MKSRDNRFNLCLILLAIVLLFTKASEAIGLPPSFSGNVEITSTDLSTESLAGTDSESNSFNQIYIINWHKEMSRYLNVQSSYNYTKLSYPQDGLIYKQEINRPSVSMTFRQKNYSIYSSYQQRAISTSFEANNNTNNNFNATFKSTFDRWPRMSLMYDYNEVYNTDNRAIKDIANKRYISSLFYEHGSNEFHYNFSYNKSFNHPKNSEVRRINNAFRWHQISYSKNNKSYFSSTYNLTASSDRQRQEGQTINYYPVIVAEGFYSFDSSPESDELDTLSQLIDQNRDIATSPLINIGANNYNQNIGVKTQRGTDVSGFYLYTDTSSENIMTFDIYTSDNNLDWELLLADYNAEFDPVLLRYEIFIPENSSEYFKVVNKSFNSYDPVMVTELETLTQIDEVRSGLTKTSHLIDLAYNYSWDEKHVTNINTSYSNAHGNNDNRTQNTNLTISHKFKVNEKLQHLGRFQSSYQHLGTGVPNLRSHGLNYSLLYDPISTVGCLLSLSNNYLYIGKSRESESRNALMRATGKILPTLNLDLESSFSWISQLRIDKKVKSWRGSISTDGNFTRNSKFEVTYSYSRSTNTSDDDVNIRKNLNLVWNNRLSALINWRAEYRINYDDEIYKTALSSLSWNLSKKVSTGSTVTYTNRDNMVESYQYSTFCSIRLKNRSNLSINYSYGDFLEVRGSKTTSLLVSFRSGF